MNDRTQSALRLQHIRNLAEETDPNIALQFLTDYLQMLPQRLHRILQGLREIDTEASMDAVLSLKIASAMAGATDTEACCHRLEFLVRDGRFATAGSEAAALTAAVLGLVENTPAVLEGARNDLS